MGYMHIDNLYKNQDILLFRECYALEKIHGTSAHVSWHPLDTADTDRLRFFSGGEKHDRFVALFDKTALLTKFAELLEHSTFFFGEAYGGKQQGMKDTYGPDLKFVVFDVKIGDSWLDVPKAEALATACGFEFVSYEKVSTDLESLDGQMMRRSEQAVRNGVGTATKGDVVFVEEEHKREGVVLRPLIELKKNSGQRIISKHKHPEFRERKSVPKVVDPEQQEILKKASAVADEWVTPMRLTHVLDKLQLPELDMKHTPEVIKAMTEDVTREAEGLIEDSKQVRKAIGAAAVKLYKGRVLAALRRED